MSEDSKVAPQPDEPEQPQAAHQQPPQPQPEQSQAQQPGQPQQAQGLPQEGVPHHQPYYQAAPAAPQVSKDGGFGRFVQNRAVQLVGAGLIGILIGGGAVATGVAVAGDDGPERNGFSRQWQAPNGGPGGDLQRVPGGGMPDGGTFDGNGGGPSSPGSGY